MLHDIEQCGGESRLEPQCERALYFEYGSRQEFLLRVGKRVELRRLEVEYPFDLSVRIRAHLYRKGQRRFLRLGGPNIAVGSRILGDIRDIQRRPLLQRTTEHSVRQILLVGRRDLEVAARTTSNLSRARLTRNRPTYSHSKR